MRCIARGLLVSVLSVGVLIRAGHAEEAPLPSAAALSQVEGAAALAWVRARNAATGKDLASDPRYQPLHDAILKAQQSPARLAEPVQMAGGIWNFWQDAAHPRGIWRSASEASFQSGRPDWRTRFDLDDLAAKEKANWVMGGLECLSPDDDPCLLGLSDAGEDARTFREFSTKDSRFVAGGFALPRGKQSVAWIDRDTLLVSRDWGTTEAGLTRSGYPYVVRLWRRGQPLDHAGEVFRGTAEDMDVSPEVLTDGEGRRLVLIERRLDFFQDRLLRFDPDTGKTAPIPMPGKYDELNYFDGRLVFHLLEDWRVARGVIPADSIVALDPGKGEESVERIFTPSAAQTVGDGMGGAIAATRDGLIAVIYENVQPGLVLYRRAPSGEWEGRRIALPGNVAARIVSARPDQSRAYLQIEGFIQPPQIWSVDTRAQVTRLLYRQPDLFDASGLVVEQRFAVSTDGTKVPYFITHRRDWQRNGLNPTLMTAYGGFGLSYLPVYHPDVGLAWLTRGGVYVMANIRGGGEFGPHWHDVALRSGRQRAYDDFAAVARDLFRTGVSSPKRLGIRGRSNGGLLMGVEFTQHPELWNAVIIGVPLLDMLDYEHMAAGASWAAEYGSVSAPENRAFWERTSPLQALRAGADYPPPFIFTSTKDDRVGPVHARLFAARLQALGVKFDYYEDVEGGHAGTVNAAEIAHERALEAIYLYRRLMDPR